MEYRNPENKNSLCATRNLSTQRMQTTTVLYSIRLCTLHILLKFFPDISCFITGNLIRHNFSYLVLNNVAHKFVLLSFYSIR